VTTIASEIKVSVQTAYINEQSDETEPRYVFSYHINIENKSSSKVQLLSRYWLITDANGETVNVAGEGVIGKQPYIDVNQSYQYASGCVLKTPIGTMEGHYQMIDSEGNTLQVNIPVFSLALPNILH
jgi:ApaG protein